MPREVHVSDVVSETSMGTLVELNPDEMVSQQDEEAEIVGRPRETRPEAAPKT